jgi:hypothetical protein
LVRWHERVKCGIRAIRLAGGGECPAKQDHGTLITEE